MTCYFDFYVFYCSCVIIVHIDTVIIIVVVALGAFQTIITGNQRLLEIGNILTIQEGSSFETSVFDNPFLCFTPLALWGHRSDSYIEYSTRSVSFYESERLDLGGLVKKKPFSMNSSMVIKI